MKRKIININEELCDGCGNCIAGCSEGALEIVDGKARLVKENFCDGFGDCIGECPTGALVVEEREAEAFDEQATKENLLKTQGKEAVRRMEEAQKKHAGKSHGHGHGKGAGPGLMHGHGPHAHGGGGCPGSAMRMFDSPAKKPVSSGSNVQAIPSELEQWPIQLHLVQPGAPFFKNKELVVLSTCSPIASADVHWRYLRGRSVVVACPKLDVTDPYVEKLAGILQETTIPKVIVTIIEVPCCKGLSMMVAEAAKMTGRKDLVVEEHILGIRGEVKEVNKLS